MNLTELLAQMPRQKALLIGVVVGLLYYLIGFNSGESYEVGAQKFQEQKKEADLKIKGIERRIERALQYQQAVDVLGGQLEKLVSYIPKEFSPVDLMRIISREAKASGTNIIRITEHNSYRSRSRDDNQFYDEISVELELEGTYAQFVLFLSYLTRLDKIITIEGLDISSKRGAMVDEAPVLNLKGSVKGYRYREIKPQ